MTYQMNLETSEHAEALLASLRLVDGVDETEIVLRLPLGEIEADDRGVTADKTFFPWHRVIDWEWDVVEEADDSGEARQIGVRVALAGAGGRVTEYVVPAYRFETKPWGVAMTVPVRAEPELRRTIVRRLSIPWHRVVEYEKQVSSPSAGADLENPPVNDLER
jgi:alkylated DNA nucleotide flippase Atl1